MKVYLKDLWNAFQEIIKDEAWIAKQQSYYPRVDIVKSIEIAIYTYWATDAG